MNSGSSYQKFGGSGWQSEPVAFKNRFIFAGNLSKDYVELMLEDDEQKYKPGEFFNYNNDINEHSFEIKNQRFMRLCLHVLRLDFLALCLCVLEPPPTLRSLSLLLRGLVSAPGGTRSSGTRHAYTTIESSS